MHTVTRWVYGIVGYNWIWLALLYSISDLRWNAEENHLRSVSGMLHLFRPAGIVGFGALCSTIFLVFVVNSLYSTRLFMLTVVILLSSMGVLGFDVT